MEEKDKELLDLYDKIIGACMVNIYSLAKENNKIVLSNFTPKLDNKKFLYEVSKLVISTKPEMKLYLEMNPINYLFFKLKHRKDSIHYLRKKEKSNLDKHEQMLLFVAKEFKQDYTIFDNIYNTYWNRKEK